MGFLRRLLSSARPPESIAQSPAPAPPTSRHPNSGRPDLRLTGGARERWAFEAPDGIAVLNAKVHNRVHAARLDGSDAASLSRLTGGRGRELVPADLRSNGNAIDVLYDGTRLGRLPAQAAERFGGLVRDHEARGWRLVTWTDVFSPSDGAPLVAEVRLPASDEPLYADAYDASFAFPRAQVFARRKTPEGKAEHEAWLAAHPARANVLVQVGEVAVRASRCGWEVFGDRTVESRGLRLKDEHSVWLPLDTVPNELARLGARIVEVAGVSHHPDHDAPAFAAEQPVRLVPEPDNPYDRNAIAIRSADGRLMAGYVPRAAAAWFHGRDGALNGLVVWEYRTVENARNRRGLRVLIAPLPISIQPG